MGSRIVVLQENSISVNKCWVSPSQNFMNSFQLLRTKFRIDCTPVWNRLPVNHTYKISPDTQHYFGAEPIFLNDDFGTLKGTEPLFSCVRVAVILFFITCDNSPDKSIIHGITDKLTTDIHSTLSLLRCRFMGYRSRASVRFSKCLNNLTMYGIFWCTKFFWHPTSTDFLWKLCIYSQCSIIYVFQNVVNL